MDALDVGSLAGSALSLSVIGPFTARAISLLGSPVVMRTSRGLILLPLRTESCIQAQGTHLLLKVAAELGITHMAPFLPI